ncbi:MAG: hypothetical protein LHV69_09050 [Elusimicrobia bacterium]|nr:hypothetical protein [Candidatus Obscuribacterium magneticum]
MTKSKRVFQQPVNRWLNKKSFWPQRRGQRSLGKDAFLGDDAQKGIFCAQESNVIPADAGIQVLNMFLKNKFTDWTVSRNGPVDYFNYRNGIPAFAGMTGTY